MLIAVKRFKTQHGGNRSHKEGKKSSLSDDISLIEEGYLTVHNLKKKAKYLEREHSAECPKFPQAIVATLHASVDPFALRLKPPVLFKDICCLNKPPIFYFSTHFGFPLKWRRVKTLISYHAEQRDSSSTKVQRSMPVITKQNNKGIFLRSRNENLGADF